MPQVADSKRFIAQVVAACAVLWLSTILLTPWISGFAEWASAGAYLVGSLICHQRPERSFHLAGAQLPVCARCTGLYLGAALGLVAWVAMAQRRSSTWPRASAITTLAVSGAPTAFTVATAWLGLLDPPNIWRAALAIPLGVVAGRVVGAMTTDHLK